MRDIFIEILSSARRNKLRTALTGFAVAWGIFMLIVLLGAGNGLINGIESNSSNFMTNSMMIGGGSTSIAYDGLKEGRDITLNKQDLKTTSGPMFKDNIDGITAELYLSGLKATYGEQFISASLLGVYPDYKSIQKVDILSGRLINKIPVYEGVMDFVFGNTPQKYLFV